MICTALAQECSRQDQSEGLASARLLTENPTRICPSDLVRLCLRNSEALTAYTCYISGKVRRGLTFTANSAQLSRTGAISSSSPVDDDRGLRQRRRTNGHTGNLTLEPSLVRVYGCHLRVNFCYVCWRG